MSIPADLQHAQAVIDDWDAWSRSDDRLASWAHDVVVDSPARDLGTLSEWAADVTCAPDFAGSPGAEQARETAERARPTGESPAGAPLAGFTGSPPPPAKSARRDDPARQELAARAQLYPRTGLVQVAPINPPMKMAPRAVTSAGATTDSR